MGFDAAMTLAPASWLQRVLAQARAQGAWARAPEEDPAEMRGPLPKIAPEEIDLGGYGEATAAYASLRGRAADALTQARRALLDALRAARRQERGAPIWTLLTDASLDERLTAHARAGAEARRAGAESGPALNLLTRVAAARPEPFNRRLGAALVADARALLAALEEEGAASGRIGAEIERDGAAAVETHEAAVDARLAATLESGAPAQRAMLSPWPADRFEFSLGRSEIAVGEAQAALFRARAALRAGAPVDLAAVAARRETARAALAEAMDAIVAGGRLLAIGAEFMQPLERRLSDRRARLGRRQLETFEAALKLERAIGGEVLSAAEALSALEAAPDAPDAVPRALDALARIEIFEKIDERGPLRARIAEIESEIDELTAAERGWETESRPG